MKIHSESYIRELLAPGVERRELEFKSPFSWNKHDPQWLKEMTTKAVLAMHNTPSGGVILVGVLGHEDRPADIPGVNGQQLRTFAREEAIIGEISSYSTEPLVLTIGAGQYRQSDDTLSDLVVIEVAGLDELPTICKRAGSVKGTLAEGAIYSRRKAGVPSSDVVTPQELEEIIRHGVARRLDWIRSLGAEHADSTGPRLEQAARREFGDQISDLWQD